MSFAENIIQSRLSDTPVNMIHCHSLGSTLGDQQTQTFVYYLYNVGPTSSTLVQHCANIIQMSCVYCVSDRS